MGSGHIFDGSRTSLHTLGVSDHSPCGAVPMLMVKEILRRDLDMEVSYRELAQISCTEASDRDLAQRLAKRPQRSCQKSSCTELVQGSLQ